MVFTSISPNVKKAILQLCFHTYFFVAINLITEAAFFQQPNILTFGAVTSIVFSTCFLRETLIQHFDETEFDSDWGRELVFYPETNNTQHHCFLLRVFPKKIMR